MVHAPARGGKTQRLPRQHAAALRLREDLSDTPLQLIIGQRREQDGGKRDGEHGRYGCRQCVVCVACAGSSTRRKKFGKPSGLSVRYASNSDVTFECLLATSYRCTLYKRVAKFAVTARSLGGRTRDLGPNSLPRSERTLAAKLRY